ncbi:MAG: ATP-binding protein [Candidatus Thorarchaeota archaeon]|jgi:PAS domain S-box-containing protein
MSERIRVLLIEDSEDDAILIERELKKGGYNPEIERVWNAESMMKALDSGLWDLILCDYMLPAFSTEDALEQVKDSERDIPFIIVSGAISEDVAVRMMKAGVHDYLKKDNLARLVPAIQREITEAEVRRNQREAEDALRESEMKHRMLVKSLRDIVFVLDKDGKIVEYYSATGLRADLDPAEIQGKWIGEVMPADVTELFMLNSERVLSDGDARSFECLIDNEGEKRAYWATLSPHEDGGRIVVVVHDVTELKRVEEELRATSNIATLYLDILQHDIRNQLQAIKIGSELLTYERNPERDPRVLAEISSSVERCDALIAAVHGTRDLLQEPLKKVSLCRTLIDCVQEFQEQQDGAIVEIDCEVAEATVRADKYIRLLLFNILENAVTHSQEEDTHIWVSLEAHDRQYEVRISDDGPGIKDEMKRTLFNPDRRFGGVGIPQACQIAEKYGGAIEVTDRIDGDWTGGAEFKVWLPRAANEA